MLRAASHLYKLFGLPGAGLIFFLEGIGVPIPVEIPLGIVGLRMVRGESSQWEIVILMWLATVAGNTAGYFLGYYGGRPLALKLIAWFRISPEVWERVETWFRRHGLKVVIATRWINWGFAQNMWLSGITRVPFGRFFAVMVVNDFFWAMAWTWLAHLAVFHIRRSGSFLRHSTIQIGTAAIAVMLVALGIWAVVRWLQKRRQGSDGSHG